MRSNVVQSRLPSSSLGSVGQRFREIDVQFKGMGDKLSSLEQMLFKIEGRTIQKSDFQVSVGSQFDYHHSLSKVLKEFESYKDSDFLSDKRTLSSDEQTRYFNECEYAIKGALRFISFLRDVPQQQFVALPLSAQSSIVDALTSLQDVFFNMQNFTKNPISSRKGSDDELYKKRLELRKELITKFHIHYQSLASFLAPLYFSENESLHERLKGVEDAVNSYANQAAKDAVGKFDALYAVLSSRFARSANYWLGGTFCMALVSMGFALCTIIEGENFTLSILGGALHTAFILAMLSALTIWCGRNYAINRHNELVNKHKELSLTTFSQFVNAGGTDAELRKVIVEKTTSAIFDSSPSGYLKMGKNESSGEFPSVMNILNPKSSQTG